MSNDETQERFAHSVIFSAIGTLGSRVINVLGALILARILSPTEFGLVAIISILTAFTLIFVEVGFGAALVHEEEPTAADYATAFTFNTVVGSIFALALYAGAGAIGNFFGDSNATPVVQVAAFLLVAHGLSIVPQAILQKRRRFRLIATTELVSSILGLCVAIVLALAGYGVWALIANLYVAAILKFVLSIYLSGWSPGAWPSAQAFSKLWSYSRYLVGSAVLDYVSTNADKIAVGRYLASDQLGAYDLASKLTLLPSNVVVSILSRVLFPTYVAGKENPEEVGTVHIEVFQLVAFLLVPLMLALSVLADEFVALVLGPKWLDAALFIRVLSLVYILRAFAALNMPVFLAHGATRLHFKLSIFSSAVVVFGVFAGIQFGVGGLLAALLVGRLLIVVPVLYLPTRLIRIEFSQVLSSLLPPVFSGILAVVAVIALRKFVVAYDVSLVWAMSSLVLFLLVYFATLFVAWPRFIDAQLGRIRPLIGLR